MQLQHRAQEDDYERLSARKPVERMAQNESGPDKSEKSGVVVNQQAAGHDNTEKRHDSNKVRDDRHQVRQRKLDRLHLEEMECKYSTTCEELGMLKSRLAYVETEKAEQIRQDQSRIQDLEYKYIALQEATDVIVAANTATNVDAGKPGYNMKSQERHESHSSNNSNTRLNIGLVIVVSMLMR